MGQILPTYLLPIRLEGEVPKDPNEAFDLLPESYFVDHQILGGREWWSKNEWYNRFIVAMASEFKLDGLEFLEREVAYLEVAGLERAHAATLNLLDAVRDGSVCSLAGKPELEPSWGWILPSVSEDALDRAVDSPEVSELDAPHDDPAIGIASALIGLESVLRRAASVGGLLLVTVQP